MRVLTTIATFIISTSILGQTSKHYITVQEDTTNTKNFRYFFMNNYGDRILKLDTAKYYVCFSDTIQYFAIVGLNHKNGWWAIDMNENVLFQVYNTSNGEPSPDELRFGMIRIVDDSGKIGFANFKGKVVIKPQFEAATSFFRDKAIIGGRCKQVLWCCEGEKADKHYMTQCKQTGYINKKGQVQQLGNLTLEEMEKKINWKSAD